MRSWGEQAYHLGQLNARGRLSLFVGAGVSQGCGLPGWKELIRRVGLHVKETRFKIEALDGFDVVTQTRILRQLLKEDFNRVVSDALYEADYTLSPVLKSIALLGTEDICTYNFDDLIEEALGVEGIDFLSLKPGEPFNKNFGGPAVYHVHGVLTASMSAQECQQANIVLDETDFNSLYSDAYSWPNLVQLSLLMKGSCLFVGCSLRDPNLRRLLDVCRNLRLSHRHYAVLGLPEQGKSGDDRIRAKQLKNVIQLELHSLNIEPIWLRDFDKSLCLMLNKIRNRKRLKHQRERSGAE